MFSSMYSQLYFLLLFYPVGGGGGGEGTPGQPGYVFRDLS